MSRTEEAKKHRRNGYKRACRPLMEKHGLTRAQVAPFVDSVMQENARLEKQVKDLKAERDSLEKQLDEVMK
jgi:cell division septum initiation protein DivIVA